MIAALLDPLVSLTGLGLTQLLILVIIIVVAIRG